MGVSGSCPHINCDMDLEYAKMAHLGDFYTPEAALPIGALITSF